MEKPLLILKPHLINAILPNLVRNLIFASIIVFIVYTILQFTSTITTTTIIWLAILLILISTLPLIVKVVVLNFTRYYFYRDRAISEFNFISRKTHSVFYNQICDVKINISIWDRICKAGDIILHTAQDNAPDLKLKYIRNPKKVEQGIYTLIRRTKK